MNTVPVTRRRPHYWVLVLLAALASLISTAGVAQPAGPVECFAPEHNDRDVFRGFTPGTPLVLLESGTYHRTNATVLQDRAGHTVGIEYFMPGMNVETDYCPSSDSAHPSQLYRMRHKGDGEPPPPPASIIGPITNIEPEHGFVSVHNVTVVVDETTEIVHADGSALTFEDLMVGQFAEVFAPFSMLTVIPTATRVVVLGNQPPPGMMSFHGAITQLDPMGGTFAVGNLLVQTTSETLFSDITTGPITFSNLAVGDFVFGLANRTGRELLTALFVVRAPANPPPPPGEVTLHGPITAIDDDTMSILVGDHRIKVTSTTDIHDETDFPLNFDDLEVGDFVFVRAERADGMLVALSIRVTANTPPPVHLTGTISNLDSAHESFTVANQLVLVNDDTVILLGDPMNGSPGTFADLANGNCVSVEGQRTGSGAVAASLIVVRPCEPALVSVEGRIQQINPPVIVVGTVHVLLTSGTLVQEFDGTPLTPADLRIGDLVRALGFPRPGTAANLPALEAVSVTRLGDGGQQNIHLVGRIEAIAEEHNHLRVAGHDVFTNPDTIIVDEDGDEIDFDDLEVGNMVSIHGTLAGINPNSPVILARRIALFEPGCIEQEVRGTLDAMNPMGWVVASRPVAITPMTTFSDEDNEPLTSADFAVGDNVEVKGCGTPGTMLEARHVRRRNNGDGSGECRPNTAFGGTVEQVASNAQVIVVDGRPVRITPETRIFRVGVGPVPFSDIETGDHAFIAGRHDDNAGSPGVLACEIHLGGNNPPPPPPGHTIAGLIDAIDATSRTLTVHNRLIQVTPNTIIRDREGEPRRFEDLAVGNFVHVAGMGTSSGAFIAHVIIVQEENDEPHAPGFVRGLLTALDLPGSISVNDRPILVNDDTKYFAVDGTEVGSHFLNVGEFVLVRLDGDRGDGDNTNPAAPTAKRVRVRAALIESIDMDEGRIVVGGIPAIVNNETVIVDMDGQALAFSDLVVGDLVRIRFSNIATDATKFARLIVLVRPAETSGAVGAFSATSFDITGNRLEIRSSDAMNSFGFISLPAESEVALPNTLYEMRMTVATDVADSSAIPTARLRLNMDDHQKGTSLVIDSNATRSLVPTSAGREYVHYFMPASQDADAERNGHFFPSLDLLSFEQRFAADANLRLGAVSVRPVDASRVRVVRTLLADEFTGGTSGWTWGGADGVYTLPRFGAEDGAIALASGDHATFGFWTKTTDVALEPGRLYRGRFLLSTNWDAATEVPEFRVRLHGSTFELGGVVNVAATGDARETLRRGVRTYDVYLSVPADAASGATVIAAVDVLNFTPDAAVDATVTLERFILEEIEVTE